MTPDLIQIRNRAIHRNAVITGEEAHKALNVASDIVEDLAPISG